MSNQVKQAFENLQKSILLIIRDNATGDKEAQAYAKLSVLVSHIQSLYEEALDLYDRIETKKPDVNGLTPRQKQDITITLYQIGRRS